MIIHFICGGNTYRSRLAEAYLNSKHLHGLKSISSGIIASANESGPISWYAQRILQNEKFVPFESLGWQQTTKEILKQGDFTIFMQQEHYDYCRENLDFTQKDYSSIQENLATCCEDELNANMPSAFKGKPRTFVRGGCHEIWDIKDMSGPSTEAEKIKASEETFKIIKRKTDDLVNRLSKKHKKF